MKIFKKAYIVIGLVIFFWLIKDIDFIRLKEIIFSVNVFYFGAIAILYFLNLVFRSWRWQEIMNTQNMHYSFWNSFLMYGSGSFIGIATPGKIGDFSKMAHLKKDKHSMSGAFLGNVMDKFSDLVFAILFTVVGIFYLPFLPHFNFNYYALIKWLVIAAMAAFSISLLVFLKNRDRIIGIVLNLINGIKGIRTKSYFSIFFSTAVSWFTYYAIVYFGALGIGIGEEIGFFYLSFAATIVIFAGLIPISVLGIGTRDAALIFMLTPLGIPKEKIIALSFLMLFSFIYLSLIYLYCWLKKPLV